MKYVVNLTDKRGKGKVKIVEALDVKEAEAKAKSKYPSYEVGRISPSTDDLNYYRSVKDFNG
tara:strand:+ start:1360 stop:1545 length:186 start_codon:yes stop_codon:yes gene_type:complete